MRNLLHKYPQYALLAGIILMVVVCYQFALKNTFGEWQEHRKLKAQETQLSDLSYQPGYLKRKSDNLDGLIKRYQLDTSTFRATVINTVSAIGTREHVRLSEVPTSIPFYHTGRFIIEKLQFEGDFYNLMKLLHELENTEGTGFLRSVEFRSVKQHTAKGEEQKLVMEVAVEIVKK